MIAKVAIIRENYSEAFFENSVCKQVDAAKEIAIAPLKVTWLIDPKGLLICIIEWCED